MESINPSSKLDKLYEDTMKRAIAHLEKLDNPELSERVESDRIFQYIQYAIDCFQLCMEHQEKGSEIRQKCARYKDSLGDIGDEIVKRTNPNRW